MKNLIFISGTMGVGKTVTANILNTILPNSVYLDGDSCWNMSPFVVNDETKAMVVDNIIHILRNFLNNSVYKNIIFTWVMHEQSIIDTLLNFLQDLEFKLYNISLVCSAETLTKRLQADTKKGIRTADVIERSVPRLPFYEKINSIKIDTDGISVAQVAKRILHQVCVLETERLVLREMNNADFPSLCKILKDKEVMYAYEHAFSDEEAYDWLFRQQKRYNTYGLGSWAVVLKETDEMIGQCGLTIQDFKGKDVLEVGYLFQKAYWHKGYATEAAIGCKKYAFDTLNVKEVFSIIRENNVASQNVAKRNGMTVCGQFIKKYYGMDMLHLVFSVKNCNTFIR